MCGWCAEGAQGGAKSLFLLLPLSVLLVLLPGLAPGGFLRNKLPTQLPFTLPTEVPFQEEGTHPRFIMKHHILLFNIAFVLDFLGIQCSYLKLWQ